MEKNQINNNTNFETKYNPFKDGSFWAALIISLVLSAQSIILTIAEGAFQPTLLVGIVLLITWTGWIIYKKGKKGSLFIGFVIAIILAGFSYIPAMKIEEKQRKAQFEKAMEEYRQNMDSEPQKMMQESQTK